MRACDFISSLSYWLPPMFMHKPYNWAFRNALQALKSHPTMNYWISKLFMASSMSVKLDKVNWHLPLSILRSRLSRWAMWNRKARAILPSYVFMHLLPTGWWNTDWFPGYVLHKALSSHLKTDEATIITSANVLSYSAFSNNSALCSSIVAENGTAGCPYGPGPFGLGLEIPLKDAYPFTSIDTQIRILDTSSPSLELACIDINTTPYYKEYFAYKLVLWLTAGLVLAWLLTMLIARTWAAHTSSVLDREAELASSLTARLSPRSLREEMGPVFWDLAGGATLQASAALRRFATPCTRDVLWSIQFAAMLGMVAVEWPNFVCELPNLQSYFSRLIRRIRSHLDENGMVYACIQHYSNSIFRTFD